MQQPPKEEDNSSTVISRGVGEVPWLGSPGLRRKGCVRSEMFLRAGACEHGSACFWIAWSHLPGAGVCPRSRAAECGWRCHHARHPVLPSAPCTLHLAGDQPPTAGDSVAAQIIPYLTWVPRHHP
jgi:hypothetical protein